MNHFSYPLTIVQINILKNPKISFPNRNPRPQTIEPAPPPVSLTIDCPPPLGLYLYQGRIAKSAASTTMFINIRAKFCFTYVVSLAWRGLLSLEIAQITNNLMKDWDKLISWADPHLGQSSQKGLLSNSYLKIFDSDHQACLKTNSCLILILPFWGNCLYFAYRALLMIT